MGIETGRFTKNYRREVAVFGLILVSTAYSLYEALHGGVTRVSPQGEGWHVGFRTYPGGIQFRRLVREQGTRPVPCREESPLTYTRFKVTEYSASLDVESGYRPRVFRYEVNADPRNLCESIPW